MTRDTVRRPGVLGDMFSRLFRDGQVDAITSGATTSGASAAAQVTQWVARQLRPDLDITVTDGTDDAPTATASAAGCRCA